SRFIQAAIPTVRSLELWKPRSGSNPLTNWPSWSTPSYRSISARLVLRQTTDDMRVRGLVVGRATSERSCFRDRARGLLHLLRRRRGLPTRVGAVAAGRFRPPYPSGLPDGADYGSAHPARGLRGRGGRYRRRGGGSTARCQRG